jgi:hypothetical protein
MEEYYEERVHQYRIYKQYVGASAREDEPWTLEWSFVTKSDAEEQMAKEGQDDIDRYARKIIDNGAESTIKRSIW